MQHENRFSAEAKATTRKSDVIQAAAVMLKRSREFRDAEYQVVMTAPPASTHKPLRFVCSGFFAFAGPSHHPIAPCFGPVPSTYYRGSSMFGTFIESLTKAALGVVTIPVAAVADVVTMGGALTDKNEPYTATAIGDVVKNLEDAAKPD